MCAHENCGFMRTYTRHIESEKRFSQKRKHSKIRLRKKKHLPSKEILTFSRCSSSCRLSLFFNYSTSGVALYNKEG